MIFSMEKLKAEFLQAKEQNKMEEIRLLAEKVKKESKKINCATYEKRHSALSKMAEALFENCEYILAENKKDLEAAKEKGISDALFDTTCQKMTTKAPVSSVPVANRYVG